MARRKTLAQRAEKPGSYSAKRGMSNKEGEGAIPNDAPEGVISGVQFANLLLHIFQNDVFPRKLIIC